MEDYEIRRNLWEGGIPVEFKLDNDVSAKSFFVFIRRVEYLPTVLGKALQFFANTLGGGLEARGEAWLECNGTPLKWHYPAGVLFDLHSSAAELPWTLTLRLGDFPDELVRKDALRNSFLQSVKEADQLKHRGRVVSEMKAEEHARLFDSVCNGRFDEFWSVNRKLMGAGEQDKFSHIPMRFYEPHEPIRQRLWSGESADGTENTLGDVLAELFGAEEATGVRVLTHGVGVPAEAPLNWMARNFAYPDNFVHLVVRRP